MVNLRLCTSQKLIYQLSEMHSKAARLPADWLKESQEPNQKHKGEERKEGHDG